MFSRGANNSLGYKASQNVKEMLLTTNSIHNVYVSPTQFVSSSANMNFSVLVK